MTDKNYRFWLLLWIPLVLLLSSCRSHANPSPLPKGVPTESPSVVLTPNSNPIFSLMIPLIIRPEANVNCSLPPNWSPIVIQIGDTLENLARTYQTTVEAVIQANCLVFGDLIPGTILYVPGPPSTESPVHCGPSPDWVLYTVQPGDTLYRIALNSGISIAELQLANCMGSSTQIRVGQNLFVPNAP